MNFPQSIYPFSVDGHFSTFWLQWIMGLLVWVPNFNCLGVYLGMELLGHLVHLLHVSRNPQCFPLEQGRGSGLYSLMDIWDAFSRVWKLTCYSFSWLYVSTQAPVPSPVTSFLLRFRLLLVLEQQTALKFLENPKCCFQNFFESSEIIFFRSVF